MSQTAALKNAREYKRICDIPENILENILKWVQNSREYAGIKNMLKMQKNIPAYSTGGKLAQPSDANCTTSLVSVLISTKHIIYIKKKAITVFVGGETGKDR